MIGLDVASVTHSEQAQAGSVELRMADTSNSSNEPRTLVTMAWRALQFMQLRLTGRLAADVTATSELSYADYLVLVVLSECPDGRARLFELAEVLGWEKSRVSHQVTRMTGRGLLRKERCGEDRRGAFVVVTEIGHRAIEAAAPYHVAMVRRLFIDRLTPGELDAVTSAAENILAGLDTETAETAETAEGHHDDGRSQREASQ